MSFCGKDQRIRYIDNITHTYIYIYFVHIDCAPIHRVFLTFSVVIAIPCSLSDQISYSLRPLCFQLKSLNVLGKKWAAWINPPGCEISLDEYVFPRDTKIRRTQSQLPTEKIWKKSPRKLWYSLSIPQQMYLAIFHKNPSAEKKQTKTIHLYPKRVTLTPNSKEALRIPMYFSTTFVPTRTPRVLSNC